MTAASLQMLLVACGGKGGDSAAYDAADPAGETLQAPVTAVADSLYAFVEAQTSLGPRTPGSEAHARCVDMLAGMLRGYGVENVTVSADPVTDAYGKSLTARNIFGSINPASDRRILLLAHYDSRPWADEDPDSEMRQTPIDGANDGASGVAVLLETARLLKEAPLDSIGVDLLLVDLEDSGVSGAGKDDSWCLGTQKWAGQMPYDNYNRPMYGILFDMVGGKGAKFHREYTSDLYARKVVDRFWAMAAASGYEARFPNTAGGSVIDDHLYVNRGGIPCIDIIESYNPQTGSFNPTWHTMEDNIKNIDPETMRMVTQVLLNLLYREEGRI